MKTLFYIFLSICIFAPHLPAQKGVKEGLKTIDAASAETYIEFLASDAMQGRKAGENSSFVASEYLKSVFRDMGLKPLFDDSYFMPFEAYSLKWGEHTRYTVDPERVDAYKKSDEYIKLGMRNVCGYIEGEKADEYVVVGAHFDHEGVNGSLSGDTIFNGADDNASGVSAVLQIAKAFKASGKKPLRTIIFALWDGEEFGLLGSQYFVNTWSNLAQVKSYLNFDMIGRITQKDKPQHVEYTYSASHPIFHEWLENNIEKHRLGISPVYIPTITQYGNSDYAPFIKKNIPVMWFMTGLHPDYHQPSDETDKIAWGLLTEITKAGYLLTWQMANNSF